MLISFTWMSVLSFNTQWLYELYTHVGLNAPSHPLTLFRAALILSLALGFTTDWVSMSRGWDTWDLKRTLRLLPGEELVCSDWFLSSWEGGVSWVSVSSSPSRVSGYCSSNSLPWHRLYVLYEDIKICKDINSIHYAVCSGICNIMICLSDSQA